MKRYTLRNYIEYMKDNPKGYWFKSRLYGWGWVPVKKEGWLVTIGFIVLLLINGFYLSSKENPTNNELNLFFGVLVILVALLIGICFKKGERPQWSWGRD